MEAHPEAGLGTSLAVDIEAAAVDTLVVDLAEIPYNLAADRAEEAPHIPAVPAEVDVDAEDAPADHWGSIHSSALPLLLHSQAGTLHSLGFLDPVHHHTHSYNHRNHSRASPSSEELEVPHQAVGEEGGPCSSDASLCVAGSAVDTLQERVCGRVR